MVKRKIEATVQYKQVKANSGTLTVIKHQLHSKVSVFLTNLITKYERHIWDSPLCVIIKGPIGSGKTFLVQNLMKQLGIKLIDLNNSQCRDEKNIRKILKDAITNFTVNKGEATATVVFFDDIDIFPECDVGFEKALKWVISSSKCPIIMTCGQVPKGLPSKNLKIFELEVTLPVLEMLYQHCEDYVIKLSKIEILYLFRYYKGNLNYIFTIFNYLVSMQPMKYENVYAEKITSCNTIELSEILPLLTFRWNEIVGNGLQPNITIQSLVYWLDLLGIIDVMPVPEVLFRYMCKFYQRHSAKIAVLFKDKPKSVDWRKLGVMGGLEDYVAFEKLLKTKY